MFKFKVNKNGTSKWIETEAICMEDAVANVFKEKCFLWEEKDEIYILTGLNSDQLYAVKEII
jgi:hypothetical protein